VEQKNGTKGKKGRGTASGNKPRGQTATTPTPTAQNINFVARQKRRRKAPKKRPEKAAFFEVPVYGAARH